jgi:hypothetical protein
MNGCTIPELWEGRTSYIEAFVTKFMKHANERHEYILRLAAAQIWDREIDEYLTCRCEGCE